MKGDKRAAPFIKWAGGKNLLLPQITPYLPKTYSRYHEPFMGSAALFFYLNPESAILSDLNQKLVSTFCGVRDNPEEIIAILDDIPINKEKYYEVRSSSPKNNIEEAAKFIYLNKTCRNGLYRENRKGEFNVPFGRRDKQSSPVVTEPEKIRSASRVLKNASIMRGDFKSCIDRAEKGDLFYFDPPYTVSHNNNGFIEYNASIFSWEDQERLACIAQELISGGCKVIISNADHKAIHDLYRNFEIKIIERNSTIASNKANRRKVTEVLIGNF